MPNEARFDKLGDRSLLVTLSQEVSVETNDLVLRLSREVEGAGIPGVEEAQPAYSSLCVFFDPARVRASYVESLIRRMMDGEGVPVAAAAEPPASLASRQVDIPVAYGSSDGPDLQWSADYLSISPEELVRRHSSRTYRVFMVGFTPGFPYLGGMDESIALPRLPQPRAKVPAGSVGIGGNQTGVYPWVTPGGWRILGRTGVEMFAPDRDDPSLLHPGDTVRFVPVERGKEDVALAGIGARSGAMSQGPEALSIPSLQVEHPGFLTMVVDEGRSGYRKLGVPVAGAADRRSYRLANLLCGNSRGEAALEMTLLGAKIRALTDVTVAVTGALAEVKIDGREEQMDRPLLLRKGSLLETGSFRTGCRAYLGVAGGIAVPQVMGSRSTYARGKFGGYQGRYLKAGDVLPAGPAPEHARITAQYSPDVAAAASLTSMLGGPGSELVLRVTPGPEAEEAGIEALCSDIYTINPESDRMGLRLAGRAVADNHGDILSSPVVPGVIQVPSDGKPLLLFCEAQTTGGYRRLAMVTEEDLSLAGQLRPGAKVRFRRAEEE